MSNNPLLSTLIHRYPSKDVEEATWSDSEDTSRSSTPPLSDVPSGKDIPGLPGDTGASMAAAEVRTTRQGNEWRDPSTIHSRSFWQRTWGQKVISSAMMDPTHHVLKESPRGPVPSMPLWIDIAFLFPITLATPALQQLCFSLGWQWSAPVAFLVYFVSLAAFFGISSIRFNYLGVKHGVFNEHERGRDYIPDSSVDIMAGGILLYFTYRVGHMVFYYYDPAVAPLTNFSWSYVLRWQAWFLVMDYLFYTYHRSTHEFDFLWRIHSHHHKSKAPTMASAILAGHLQHIWEIIVIPSLTTFLVPLSFHEQWCLYLSLAHIETMGHSGVRIHAANPNTWLSCLPFGAELTIEDHDLHHRYGKSGKNYGKQTRLYDLIFGTMEDRVESKDCTTRWL